MRYTVAIKPDARTRIYKTKVSADTLVSVHTNASWRTPGDSIPIAADEEIHPQWVCCYRNCRSLRGRGRNGRPRSSFSRHFGNPYVRITRHFAWRDNRERS